MLDLRHHWTANWIEQYLAGRSFAAGREVDRIEIKTSSRPSALVRFTDRTAVFLKHDPAVGKDDHCFFEARHAANIPPIVRRLSVPLIDFDPELQIAAMAGLADHVSLNDESDQLWKSSATVRLIGRAIGKLHACTAGLPPGKLGPFRRDLHIRTYEDITPAQFCNAPGTEYPLFLRLVQQERFQFYRLRASWKDECLIHGDLKGDNILTRRHLGPPDSVVFVDWELAGRGDAMWDVGVFAGHCIFAWLHSMRPAIDQPLDAWLQSSDVPLSALQSLFAEFFEAYRQARPVVPSWTEDLGRAIRYAAVFLFQRGLSSLLFSGRLSIAAHLAIELGRTALRSPELALTVFAPGAIPGD